MGAVTGLIGGSVGAVLGEILELMGKKAALDAGLRIIDDFWGDWDIDNWCNVADFIVALVGIGAGYAVEAIGNKASEFFSGNTPRDPELVEYNKPKVGGCSFSADTVVMTPDGEKEITEIQIGDTILGYNEEEEAIGAFVVTAIYAQRHETTLDLTINGEVVHTTDEHPFLVMDGDTTRWVEAGQIKIGDTVLAADGTTGIVEAVEVVDQPQTMYNLTVALAHTFVVGENGWVVHNQEFVTNDKGLIIGFKGQLTNRGVLLPHAPELEELISIYNIVGVELGLGNEIVLPNGQGGNWYLYNGEMDRVLIPNTSPRNIPQRSVAHLHPKGTQVPSEADINNLTVRSGIKVRTNEGWEILQDRSFIIPLESTEDGVVGRSIPYYPNTKVDDYFSEGKHGQYYNEGGVNYLEGCKR